MKTQPNQPCPTCEAQPARLELAERLESGRYRQSGDRTDPLLRDREEGWSVTGLAAETLTPTLWVRDEDGDWRYYHPEQFPDPELIFLPGTRTYRHEWTPDEGELRRIRGSAGDGLLALCPEEVLHVLGVCPEDYVAHLTVRAGTVPGVRYLDQLDFNDAARLLREEPELLSPCTCSEEE